MASTHTSAAFNAANTAARARGVASSTTSRPIPIVRQHHRHRDPAARSNTTNVIARAAASVATAETDADFRAAASGEWEGHRVYFDATGKAQLIPDRFVPPAFKEYGVDLVDWQSQCAMNVTVEDGVYARELRFLPTQGCEADASTVESEEIRTLTLDRVAPAPSSSSLAPGSYSADTGDLGTDASDSPVTVEHCVGLDTTMKNGEVVRCRVRVQQTVGQASDKQEQVADVTAWKEYYYEPFANAKSLCASCGGPNKWGEYPPKDKAEYTGNEWEGDAWDGFAKEGDDGAATVMLPSGVWCERRTNDLGGVTLSAGWLVPDREAVYLAPVRDVDTHLVSVRVYDGEGRLAETRFIKRTRKPAA